MTSPSTLVPHVEEVERLVFHVASETSAGKKYRVDLEENEGLGQCDCEDYRCNGNKHCKHLRRVRAFVAVKVAQAVINWTKK